MWASLCVALVQSPTIPLVEVASGTLPLVISAPHGGSQSVPDVPLRQGKGIAQFTTVRDTNTDLLAKAIAEQLSKATQKQPFLVIAKFDRRFIDTNRKPSQAYEVEAAKATYDLYHLSLSRSIESAAKLGPVWLIDVHGQGVDPKVIFTGTQNRKTLTEPAAAWKDGGIFTSLQASGLTLSPDSADGAEDKRFGGGYIVQTYGAMKNERCSAIQLEFGSSFRNSERARLETARKVVDALLPIIHDARQKSNSVTSAR
jgi:N-formylglutamate amidohydrolase